MDDREYELKQAELALKEREVIAKEKKSHVTWLKNPVVLGLIGTTLALVVNIITTGLNNRASEKAEHLHAQSDLVLQVIKTNGNTDDACKNLNFFVRIGWLEDPNGTIHNVCGKKGQDGVPTLPAIALGDGASAVVGGYGNAFQGLGIKPPFAIAALVIRVEDADSHEPIGDAKISREDSSRSEMTDATGTAVLNFISSQTRLTVSKDGYESTTQYPCTLSGWQSSFVIDLHRAPKSKH